MKQTTTYIIRNGDLDKIKSRDFSWQTLNNFFQKNELPFQCLESKYMDDGKKVFVIKDKTSNQIFELMQQGIKTSLLILMVKLMLNTHFACTV